MIFTDQNFKQEVEDNKGLILVDFFAEWCGPCKLLAPVINELIEEYKGKSVKIGKLNVDENKEIAEKYNIMGIPAIIIFKEGKIVVQLTGYQPKEALKELIDKNI
ncbi:thioredoxin [Patescibacteria group bacterium]|nr:thioredoxin [Patescibacteria group bacterium]